MTANVDFSLSRRTKQKKPVSNMISKISILVVPEIRFLVDAVTLDWTSDLFKS
jgi:hypothetical protein